MNDTDKKLLIENLAQTIVAKRGRMPKSHFSKIYLAKAVDSDAQYNEYLFAMWYGAMIGSAIPIKGMARALDKAFTTAICICVYTADEEEQVRVKHGLDYNGDHDTFAPGAGRDEPDFKDFNNNLYEHKGLGESPTSPHKAIAIFKRHSKTEIEIWYKQPDGSYKMDAYLENGYNFLDRDYSVMPKWMKYDDFYELTNGTLINAVNTRLTELGFVWPVKLEV